MMGRRISSLLIVSLFLGFTACGGKKIKLSEDTKITKDGVSVWATWVKDKGKKYDVQFNISNSSKNDIIILLDDMNCYRGATRGMLKHTFFNTGERTIDFRAGQMKAFNLVCDYKVMAEGDFKITIARAYDNPGGDGRTRGKAVANDIEWKVTASK